MRPERPSRGEQGNVVIQHTQPSGRTDVSASQSGVSSPEAAQAERRRPRVSVVVPVYQSETTLGATLSGALTQTYPDVEVVVCLDGPTDHSATIVEGYGDLVTVVRQENSGLSAARNSAIARASGEPITLCDADDVLLPQHVERSVAAWLDGPERSFVSANGLFLSREGITGRRIFDRVPGGHRSPRMAMLEGNVATILSTFPKSMWEELGGFSTSLQAMEDYDFWLRAVFAGWSLRHVEEPTALYRLTPGSMSSGLERMNEANRQVRERLAASGVAMSPEEKAFLEKSLAGDWVGYTIEAAGDALAEGDTPRAATLLRDAADLAPSDRRLRLKAELLRRAPVTARYYRRKESSRRAAMAR